jgi:glycosyltransferase involved in cell wall biosynthesis
VITNVNIKTGRAPQVSIGMPVYNGEDTIGEALDSLLAQTFTDFELIISDNASTDGTEAICRGYAAKDSRIRYVRQVANFGGAANFQFVLDEAVGDYFMWAAADDWWSPNFIEVNAHALDSNTHFVASTSPNCYQGEQEEIIRRVQFSIEGNLTERMSIFMRYAWKSHGIFYSLMRTKLIKECDQLGNNYFALDWLIDLYLARNGYVHRSKDGLFVIGRHGMSQQQNYWRQFRNKPTELVMPLYEFSKYAIKQMKELKAIDWIKVAFLLLKLNITASRLCIKSEIRFLLKYQNL